MIDRALAWLLLINFVALMIMLFVVMPLAMTAATVLLAGAWQVGRWAAT